MAKWFVECKKKARTKIKTCYHPNCSNRSINSHILQKKGILSKITSNSKLWEIGIFPFKNPPFQPKEQGLNKILSFNCFCNEHDSSLFSKIETEEIDFSDYNSRLLFIVRIVYHEMFKKEVNIDTLNCLLPKLEHPGPKNALKQSIKGNQLGLKDMKALESVLWQDLNNQTESFVLEYREIERVDMIIASIINYETTAEINDFYQATGRDMDISEIFVCLFPYKEKSILLMGYQKKYTKRVKGYVNSFLKEKEKKLHRRLTNLILFQCESWVCSQKLYEEKVKGNEDLFSKASYFSQVNPNERRNFDLNIFKSNFGERFREWNKYGR